MTTVSSYQPFLIGQGQYKTGLFQYLHSWIKPEDAFDVLEDAYVYRGSLFKRNGMVTYPGGGYLYYIDTVQLAVGNGFTTNFTGTLAHIPLANGFTITFSGVTMGGGTVLTATATIASGTVVLTGTLLSAFVLSVINGTTGGYSITTTAALASGYPLMVSYTYAPTQLSTPLNNPIMAIKTFINQTDNTKQLVVCDTRRACFYNLTTMMFVPLNQIQQTDFSTVIADGTGPFTITTGWVNLAPYTVSIYDGTTTVTDNGIGGYAASGNFANTTTVNYATGVITLNLTGTANASYTITATLQGDYFTGNNTNFFNATNWQPSDTAKAYLYLTNNVDRITTYDGTYLSRLNYYVQFADQATFTNGITTCLDIKVYKNSLLLFRPTNAKNAVLEPQSIRYSAPFLPQNLVADITGNGGLVDVPTGDWLFAASFLRDAIVIFFQDSTWLFRYSGSAFDPFRVDKLNVSRSTNAPYAAVSYDSKCTSAGNKGLIHCDGNTVERYDIAIIDQFLQIEPVAFGQCFSQKFDSINQTWMLFPEVGAGGGNNDQLTSNQILIYNFLENTWAIYNNPLSCLGIYQTTSDLTWADFAPDSGSIAAGYVWEGWTNAWTAYQNLADQPALLGGDQKGFVYQLDTGNTDNGQVFSIDVTTKRLNPFITQGEKATFGYLDIYYNVAPSVVLTINFYINGSSAPDLQRQITLDTPTNDPYDQFAWKRIYINIVGQFLQIGITDNGSNTFGILGMVLYAKPSGRLTPGIFS